VFGRNNLPVNPFILANMSAEGQTTIDHQRFAGWVEEHSRAIRGFLFARVHDRQLTEDLCQEVFRRAWAARSRYREQDNARAYLLTIADRLTQDNGRAKRSVTLDEAGWASNEPACRDDDPMKAAVQADEIERLTSVMAQLSPLQQRVLLLRFYGQLTFGEIAEVVACPLNTVLSHCRRGLETLRKLMGDDET
jgi:RNA polymerase sigma-70 factor, ECF subfamily